MARLGDSSRTAGPNPGLVRAAFLEIDALGRLVREALLPGSEELNQAIDRARELFPRHSTRKERVDGGSTRRMASGSAIEIVVLKGKSDRKRIPLPPGGAILVGAAADCGLRFRDPGLEAVCCEIASRSEKILLEVVDPTRPVVVAGTKRVTATLSHLDIICLTKDSWLQIHAPDRNAGPSRSPSGRIELMQESSGKEIAIRSCGGGCGKLLGEDELVAEGAVATRDDLYCLECLARGAGPFETADGYRLLHRLARGGLGDVYLALETGARELVALKILLGIHASDADAILRFFREARVGQELRHPNIVPCLGSGRLRDVPYLIMEYARGKTIRQLLEKRGRLEISFALQVGYQITKALGYAHAMDIVHRDIKPENILFDRKHRSARLLDLGLAKNMSMAGQSFVTSEGQSMGTIHYMPPEQIEEARDVDHRADIYSLGATLYEMVTGARPFGRGGHTAVFARILEGRRVPLEEALPDRPPALEGLIARAMARRREERFQSAAEMGRAIRQVLDEVR